VWDLYSGFNNGIDSSRKHVDKFRDKTQSGLLITKRQGTTIEYTLNVKLTQLTSWNLFNQTSSHGASCFSSLSGAATAHVGLDIPMSYLSNNTQSFIGDVTV
jgi:hypothetical protein